MEKLIHFPAWKNVEKNLNWSVSVEKENNFSSFIFSHLFA